MSPQLSVVAEAAPAVVQVKEPRVAAKSAVDPCAVMALAVVQVAAPALAQVSTPRVVVLSTVDLCAGARTADPLRASALAIVDQGAAAEHNPSPTQDR